ncbi:hypothetical protein [Streptomyces sp. NPDC059651]|uniref:hypothetical protein n=1 Tax=Streptomyces sp. NPDC059651 TaxID=3346897 RepID=UPI0036765EE6
MPELAGRVRAVAFDADTGCLDVVSDTSAAGTTLRWSAPKLIEAANAAVSGANVRALHVLAPAHVKDRAARVTAAPGTQPNVLTAPVQRRPPPDGYARAKRTARPRRRPGSIRVSRKRWNGRRL